MTIERDDDALRDTVLAELAWDSNIDESQVDVGVDGGVVTLVGTAYSYAEKLAVQQAALAVEGVHDLVNDIDVKPRAETRPSDARLTELAEQALSWDALVPDQDLEVLVTDGSVVLSGEVGVASQRQEAERAVAHLEGVRGVTNRITVAEPDMTPDEVRQAITEALHRRASHRADHIDVVVDGRTVTLRGTTQTRLEKVAILGAVTHAPGIEVVCDELRIDPNT
ncbi:MAG: BON domain-containing protein [Actinomycetia bacterium]|nr:BON domain-containing protein [Actinomycetes bacterium]